MSNSSAHRQGYIRSDRGASRLSRHRRLWIDAQDAADIGRKADRQQAGPGSEVDQGFVAAKLQRVGRRRKELGGIRFAPCGVGSGSGFEAAHRNPN
jgi:hypothetical protein